MVIATDDLIKQLRAWMEKGNTFVAYVSKAKYPYLLPYEDDEDGEICLWNVVSPDELQPGIEIFSLEIAGSDSLYPVMLRTVIDLSQDWTLAVLRNRKQISRRRYESAVSALEKYLSQFE